MRVQESKSVAIYQPMPRGKPEERRPQLHGGGSLKGRIVPKFTASVKPEVSLSYSLEASIGRPLNPVISVICVWILCSSVSIAVPSGSSP
jgi:hypothetical protein